MDINILVSVDEKFYDCVNNLAKAIKLINKEIKTAGVSKSEELKEEIKATGAGNTEELKEEVKTADITDNTEQQKYTTDDVREAMLKLAQSKGKPEVKKLMSEYGATKISELEINTYEAIIKAAEGRL